MVIGTENLLLQMAFRECKDNNHEWLNNIYHFLYKNGLGHIWEGISGLNAGYLKSKIDQRLKDQYMQYYSSYIQENERKSEIVRLCSKGFDYSKQDYIEAVTHTGLPDHRAVLQ